MNYICNTLSFRSYTHLLSIFVKQYWPNAADEQPLKGGLFDSLVGAKIYDY